MKKYKDYIENILKKTGGDNISIYTNGKLEPKLEKYLKKYYKIRYEFLGYTQFVEREKC